MGEEEEERKKERKKGEKTNPQSNKEKKKNSSKKGKKSTTFARKKKKGKGGGGKYNAKKAKIEEGPMYELPLYVKTLEECSASTGTLAPTLLCTHEGVRGRGKKDRSTCEPDYGIPLVAKIRQAGLT